jgi:predicted nucleic acid-binding protein
VSAIRLNNAEPLALVVDASIGIKMFVLEDGTEKVDSLFQSLTLDPPSNLFVPDLFYVECANILWKYVRRFSYPAESARQDIADLQMLALRSLPTAALIADALELALELDVTAYDACYAALARRLELPLVTADTLLAQKLANTGITVITLDNLST